MAKKKDPAVEATKPRSKDRHKARKSVSLSPALHAQLRALAKKNHRPLQWELQLAIAAHLRQAGIEPKLPLGGDPDPSE